MGNQKMRAKMQKAKSRKKAIGVVGRMFTAYCFLLCSFCFAQQPNSQPIYNVNSEAVQGVGPGTWTYGSDVNIYVSTTGNDSSGNGTSGNPYATIGRALQDIPMFVSQHYIINLAAGTYYGEVDIVNHYFPMNAVSNFNKNAIEIKGNPSSPDSYIISGATSGAPTTPSGNYAVFASHANLILNGVSTQYPVQECVRAIGGYVVMNDVTMRHSSNSSYWGGLLATADAFVEITGSLVTSDVTESVSAYDHAYVEAGLSVDPLNTGFSAASPITLTSEGGGDYAVDTEFTSIIDLEGTTGITCTSSGDGIVEVSSSYFSETTNISGCVTGVSGINFGQMEINVLSVTTATTGVELQNSAQLDTYGNTPTFTSVTTPWDILSGSKVTGGMGTIYSSNKVGIGTTSPQEALEVNGGMRLNTATSEPSCSSTIDGTFWVVQGGVGVKDNVQVCAKDATNTYAWRTIY